MSSIAKPALRIAVPSQEPDYSFDDYSEEEIAWLRKHRQEVIDAAWKKEAEWRKRNFGKAKRKKRRRL